jgi:hypothetical protein
MPPLGKKLRDVPLAQPKKRKEPLWRGPKVDGVTQSMLGKFLNCRERFRLYVIEGIKANETFNHRLEVGNLWHLCEEGFAKSWNGDWKKFPLFLDYVQELTRKYPLARAEIDKWYNVIKTQFPLYIEHWKKHPDTSKTTHLLQEHVFDIPYKLPSGRVVRLRGKWDGVDLIEDERGKGIYLFETKTKSEIDQEKISRQLTFDLQVMLYLVALERFDWRTQFDIMKGNSPLSIWTNAPIRGVRYNVVRRPLSGGKGTIVQKKGSKNVRPETKEEFYGRLRGIISDSPTDFFARWKVEITPRDIRRFRERCLDPILESLCDWWEYISTAVDPFDTRKDGWEKKEYNPHHWIHPHGCENSIDTYGATDVDEYLTNGSMAGLTVTDSLFKELE